MRSAPEAYARSLVDVDALGDIPPAADAALEQVWDELTDSGWGVHEVDDASASSTLRGVQWSAATDAMDRVIVLSDPRFADLPPCGQAALLRHEAVHARMIDREGARRYARSKRRDPRWSCALEIPAARQQLIALAACGDPEDRVRRVAELYWGTLHPAAARSAGMSDGDAEYWADLSREILEDQMDELYGQLATW